MTEQYPGYDNTVFKTPAEWLATDPYIGVRVLDPDGWDRSNLAQSWAEPITRLEFDNRLSVSTAQYPADFFKRFMQEAGGTEATHD